MGSEWFPRVPSNFSDLTHQLHCSHSPDWHKTMNILLNNYRSGGGIDIDIVQFISNSLISKLRHANVPVIHWHAGCLRSLLL